MSGRLNDFEVAMKDCREWIPSSVNRERILILSCGDGSICKAFTKIFGVYENIIATDSSPEIIEKANQLNNTPGIEYKTLDFLDETDVTNFTNLNGQFHFVIVFCYALANVLGRALQNVRLLMNDNGRCFVAFLGSSPVSTALESLKEEQEYSGYLKPLHKVVPITDCSSDPKKEVSAIAKQQGFQIMEGKCQKRLMYATTKNIFKQHVLDINPFREHVTQELKLHLIEKCSTEVFGGDNDKGVFYKIVLLLLKDRSSSRENGEDSLTDESSAEITSDEDEGVRYGPRPNKRRRRRTWRRDGNVSIQKD